MNKLIVTAILFFTTSVNAGMNDLRGYYESMTGSNSLACNYIEESVIFHWGEEVYKNDKDYLFCFHASSVVVVFDDQYRKKKSILTGSIQITK